MEIIHESHEAPERTLTNEVCNRNLLMEMPMALKSTTVRLTLRFVERNTVTCAQIRGTALLQTWMVVWDQAA